MAKKIVVDGPVRREKSLPTAMVCTATHGDLRTRIIPATDSESRALTFSDEYSARGSVWGHLRIARACVPTYGAEQRALNRQMATKIGVGGALEQRHSNVDQRGAT